VSCWCSLWLWGWETMKSKKRGFLRRSYSQQFQ
jgi:hypothetical protein